MCPPTPARTRGSSTPGAHTEFQVFGLTLYVADFISSSPTMKELILQIKTLRFREVSSPVQRTRPGSCGDAQVWPLIRHANLPPQGEEGEASWTTLHAQPPRGPRLLRFHVLRDLDIWFYEPQIPQVELPYVMTQELPGSVIHGTIHGMWSRGLSQPCPGCPEKLVTTLTGVYRSPSPPCV